MMISESKEISPEMPEKRNRLGIISYGAGNIFSLTAALDRLNIEYSLIHTVADFDGFDHYIIPGVGHAGAAMEKLQASGMVEKLKKTTKPVLGICVGMQLLTTFSEEGNALLLGISPQRTCLFPDSLNVKVPHTGWNKVYYNPDNELFNSIKPGEFFYFVHSYFIEFNPTFTTAHADYGLRFSAALKKNNFYGVQFHPEKSGVAGEHLLKNFISL